MLTLIKELNKKTNDGHKLGLYKCDCGKIKEIPISRVKNGYIKSCGCLIKEIARKRLTTHNMSKSKEYKAWDCMKSRCYDKNYKNYHCWGGKGIKVCDRWLHSFENFYQDMGRKPTKKHTLERINNNGNYEPGNCKWATYKEQSNNKTTNNFITYKNKTQTVTQWANEYHINISTLRHRLFTYNWPIEKALNKSLKLLNIPVTFNGKTQNLSRWSKELNFNRQVMWYKLYKKNIPVEEAFTIYLQKENNES